MKKQTHLHLGRPEGEYILSTFLFWVHYSFEKVFAPKTNIIHMYFAIIFSFVFCSIFNYMNNLFDLLTNQEKMEK